MGLAGGAVLRRGAGSLRGPGVVAAGSRPGGQAALAWVVVLGLGTGVWALPCASGGSPACAWGVWVALGTPQYGWVGAGLGAELSSDHKPLILSPIDVRAVQSRLMARKAAGLDDIPGRVLRSCAGELAGDSMDIFNLSLAHAVVPTCFKTTSFMPVQTVVHILTTPARYHSPSSSESA